MTGTGPPPRTVDTSRMSEGKAAAVELTEGAREALHGYTTFAGSLFMGRVRWPLLHPWRDQPPDERAETEAFLARLEEVLRERVDPDEVDRTGEIPQEAVDALAAAGAFGIKIPKEHGGLGLGQVAYTRAAMLAGGWCMNTTALLSAHQSIGVPQPLLLFGTDEQRSRLLPRLARGEISAFALTEADAGSDPARMETTARPEGDHYVLDGEKLWCTNGTRASLAVVVARTPAEGNARRFTAFVVDLNAPGVEIAARCRFMGLRALYNGVIRFRGVKVPREDVLGPEGHGLRVALTTLNTGRLTLPAAAVGLARRCLETSRKWAREREQWGAPIGRHELIADKLARMASWTFAMEAMTLLTSALVDGKTADVRLEAAMCKLWCTEAAWSIVNDTMQIRGGRGYETAESLRERGEEPVPVERWIRDNRINLVFEGSSEILRLFLAREALDPHLEAAGDLLDARKPFTRRARAGLGAALFYGVWYPRQWVPWTGGAPPLDPRLEPHARWLAGTSRRLARALFHRVVRHGPALEERQLLLARLVDVGTELFAVAATLVRADHLAGGPEGPQALALADSFCHGARRRVRHVFVDLARHRDREDYTLAQRVLEGEAAWLERGGVGRL